MWALLSDPGHADSFGQLGEAYAPLRRLVAQLARREYAGRVYAFEARASLNLTTAPTQQEAAGRDGVGIEYLPDRGSFAVGYSQWAPPAGRPRIRAAASRDCGPQEVGEVLDRCVQRLLLSRPPAEVEASVVQTVILLALFAGMFAYLLFWVLGWAGLPVERLACVSMGVVGVATGLNFIGEALRPRWLHGNQWNPRPGRVVMVPGRLTSLSFGLWFGAGGVAFLGYGWLTEHIAPAILGAFAAAAVLVLVGHQFDRRRAEATRARVGGTPCGECGRRLGEAARWRVAYPDFYVTCAWCGAVSTFDPQGRRKAQGFVPQ